MRRRTVRTIVVAGCCVGALFGLPATSASALPALDRSAGDEAIVKVGELLRQRLGPAFAGYWLDEVTGRLVVGVTQPNRAAVVQLVGGLARVLPRSAAALDAKVAALDGQAASVPPSVTGWYVDLPTNSVVVSVLGSDPAAAAFAAAAGDGVRIEQVTEAPVPYWSIIGGQAITTTSGSSSWRCSVGFNAKSGSTRYVITAGHCTNLGSTWNGAGGVLGSRYVSKYPIDDYGLIRVTSSSATSTALVDRWSSGSDVTVAGSTSAAVGARVCRSGSTTAWRCGTVQSKNQTVNYGGGKLVFGLTKTSACAEGGDSGGAFVTEPSSSSTKVQAQGMTSGGSGNCSSGGTTYFQPVGEVLSAYGLTLYLG